MTRKMLISRKKQNVFLAIAIEFRAAKDEANAAIEAYEEFSRAYCIFRGLSGKRSESEMIDAAHFLASLAPDIHPGNMRDHLISLAKERKAKCEAYNRLRYRAAKAVLDLSPEPPK